MKAIDRSIELFIVILFVSACWSCARGWSILVKTCETFKLADLQLLEAQQQAEALSWECRRVILDVSTGSSLLEVKSNEPGKSHVPLLFEQNEKLEDAETRRRAVAGCSLVQTPTSLLRADWVGVEIARGQTPEALLKNARDAMFLKSLNDHEEWVLHYTRMESSREGLQRPLCYTARTLSLCMTQQVLTKGKAALNPANATVELRIIDSRGQLYLIHQRKLAHETRFKKRRKELLELWSSRPFQYSSAINPGVAEIVVDLLQSLNGQGREQQQQQNSDKNTTLLDPTCGSGTFLAFAAAAGMNVQGWDVNAACVEGAKANLLHCSDDESTCAFEEPAALGEAIHRRDSTLPGTREKHHTPAIHCVSANLPWGQNTILYEQENIRIMKAILSVSTSGSIPCAFVTRAEQVASLHKNMNGIGYSILGSAFVPQSNFVQPGKQGRKMSASSSSTCCVTIAQTPPSVAS